MLEGPLSTRAKVLAFFSSVRARAAKVAGARWARPLARSAAVVSALAVLALLGRSTFAHPAAIAAPIEVAVSAAPSPLAPPSASAAASAAPLPPASPPPDPAPAATHRGLATPDDPVVLNVATLEDLERLPHVGAKRAEAILALRTHLGRFHQIDDLMRVKGIGRATLKKIRPLVRLDAPPPPPAPSASTGGSIADRGA